MRVLVYEPNFRGHFYAYLNLMITAVQGTGVEVVVALTKQGAAGQEYATLLRPLEALPRVRMDAWMDPDPGPGFRGAMFRTWRLLESVRRADADHVLVP